MRFASLGSGSQGNATIVSCGDQTLLVDCGFSVNETRLRLSKFGLEPGDLSAILVTHEHTDHFKGVLPLARTYRIPVYMTPGTARQKAHVISRAYKSGQDLPQIQYIKDGQQLKLGNFTVLPVAVPHDAREPVQFVLETDGKRLGILTDLGKITTHVIQHYQYCDALVLEANHDLEMLQNGSYPYPLKKRVSSNWGHLNNHQSHEFLDSIDRSRIQVLVLAHISQQNNSVARVKEVMLSLEETLETVHYACQQKGFGWFEL